MNKDLYIKNIALEISEEELRKLFAVCGKVTYVHMVKDAQSGAFVGCAYVKMSSEAEAKDAMVTLDGARLGNREIVVKEALPQRPAGSKGPGKFAGRPANQRPAPTGEGFAARDSKRSKGSAGSRGKGTQGPPGETRRKTNGPGAGFGKGRGSGKGGGRGK